jgi:hypothetical protein
LGLWQRSERISWVISNIIVSNMPQTQYTINPGLDLDMLGTIPEYRRLGVENMLVKWGVDLADRDELE